MGKQFDFRDMVRPTGAATSRALSDWVTGVAITPQMYGAKADSTGTGLGTDDAPRIGEAATEAIIARKPLYVPGGAYRIGSPGITIDHSAIANITDPRLTIIGAGPGLTLFYFDVGDYTGLNWRGGTGAGLAALASISGINFRKSDLLGAGIKIEDAAYFSLSDVYTSGWNFNIDLRDCLSSELRNVTSRFGNYGLNAQRDAGSQPNALSLHSTRLANNQENGAVLTRPGNFSMFGGSIEVNGALGDDATKGGLYVTEGPSQAGCSLGLHGTYVEGNVGDAEILISNSSGHPGVYHFSGASLQRISNVNFTTNLVRAIGSSVMVLSFKGSAFKGLGSYVPDASRKYINTDDAPNAIVDLDASNYQMHAIEATGAGPNRSWNLNGDAAVSASTLEETLKSLTIPGGWGANGLLEVIVTVGTNSNANTKTLKVKLGGTTFSTTTLTVNAAIFRLYVPIANQNSVSAQKGGATTTTSFNGFGATTATPISATLNTNTDLTLEITGQKADAGDTLTVNNVKARLTFGR